jgi:hypothetical protein
MLDPPHLFHKWRGAGFLPLLFHLSSSLSFNTAIVKIYLLVRSLLSTLVTFPLTNMYSIAKLLTLAVLSAPLTSTHDVLVATFGDPGGNGTGLGVSSVTSNDQQEVTQLWQWFWNGWRMVGFLHYLGAYQ